MLDGTPHTKKRINTMQTNEEPMIIKSTPSVSIHHKNVSQKNQALPSYLHDESE
jgi:hypothetical protein